MTKIFKKTKIKAPIFNKVAFNSFLKQFGSYLTLTILVIVSSFLAPKFLTEVNIFTMLRQAAALGIVAVGQTFVILTAGVDLSVSSMLSLSVVLVTSMYQYNDALLIPLFLLVIVIGVIVGIMNGFFITQLRIPPIIMTLGMLTLVQGLGLMYTKGVPQNTLSETFRNLGLGKVGIVPIPVIFFAVIVVIAIVILNYTNFGRYVYAVGGNPEAARLSGVNVKLVTMTTYIISAICAAIAGYVLAARIGVGDNWVGGTINLDSVAAVVIGGTSFTGGRGGVITTIAGVLILSILYNLLLLMGVVYFWQEVVKGIVILIGVIIYIRGN
jgi:ribose/xylose/arabinose/galactoside ABC-type transport system permease subunit